MAVYHSASKQKAWDHFTKAQRKNISVWCKQAEVGIFFLVLDPPARSLACQDVDVQFARCSRG